MVRLITFSITEGHFSRSTFHCVIIAIWVCRRQKNIQPKINRNPSIQIVLSFYEHNWKLEICACSSRQSTRPCFKFIPKIMDSWPVLCTMRSNTTVHLWVPCQPWTGTSLSKAGKVLQRSIGRMLPSAIGQLFVDQIVAKGPLPTLCVSCWRFELEICVTIKCVNDKKQESPRQHGLSYAWTMFGNTCRHCRFSVQSDTVTENLVVSRLQLADSVL